MLFVSPLKYMRLIHLNTSILRSLVTFFSGTLPSPAWVSKSGARPFTPKGVASAKPKAAPKAPKAKAKVKAKAASKAKAKGAPKPKQEQESPPNKRTRRWLPKAYFLEFYMLFCALHVC